MASWDNIIPIKRELQNLSRVTGNVGKFWLLFYEYYEFRRTVLYCESLYVLLL